MEISGVKVLRRRDEDYGKNTRSHGSTLRKNRFTTEVCLVQNGIDSKEYDSEEKKRSKEDKVFLMTNLRDLMVQEGAAVACAKRRDALCFIRFMI